MHLVDNPLKGHSTQLENLVEAPSIFGNKEKPKVRKPIKGKPLLYPKNQKEEILKQELDQEL